MPENTPARELTSAEIEAMIVAKQAEAQDPQPVTPTETPTTAAAPVANHIAPVDKLGEPVEEKRYLDQTNYIRDLERQKAELAKQIAVQEGIPAWVESEPETPLQLDQVKDNSLDADTRNLRKEIAVMQFNQTNKVDAATDLAVRKLIYVDDPTLKVIWDQNPKAALNIAYKMVKADQLEAQLRQTPPENPEQRLNARSEHDLTHQVPESPLSLDDLKGLSAAEQEKLITSALQS